MKKGRACPVTEQPSPSCDVTLLAARHFSGAKVSAALFYDDLEASLGLVGLFSQAHEHIDDSGIFAGSWVEE